MFNILKKLFKFKNKEIQLSSIDLPIFNNNFGFLNYTKFKVTGINILTNRKKGIEVDAKTKEDSISIAKTNNLKEPFSVEIIPFREPSDRQLNYAKDLNVYVPENACLEDVICIISRMVDDYEYQNDKYSPNVGLAEYADMMGLKFSKFIGKQRLYNYIFNSLELKDKIAFFIFSVYRWSCDDRHANLNTSPHKNLFYEFAENNLSNESFIKSMNKYSGKDIRFFGELSTSDGYVQTGGSINTIAYKTCIEFLKKNFKVKNVISKAF